MEVIINGRPRTLAPGTTVGTIVDEIVADRRGVAAAVDGAVVARRDWDLTTLEDGARVEIVAAVQGG